MIITERNSAYSRMNKGFSLAELLIVVAIIAVLVAVAFMVLPTALEKSREATDLANIRAAYAEVATEVNQGNYDQTSVVNLVEKTDGWTTAGAGVTLSKLGIVKDNREPAAGGTCTVYWDQDENKVVFDFSGEGGSSGPTGYIKSDARKDIMMGLCEAIADLKKDGYDINVSWYGQCFDANGDNKTPYAGYEKWINTSTLNSLAGPCNKKLGELLSLKGIDVSKFDNPDYAGTNATCIFTDPDGNPLAVGYYSADDSTRYNMIFLESGKCYENIKIQSGISSTIRRQMAINEDYAKTYTQANGGTISNY